MLTGGSAKMEGAIELAEEVFHMPVRLGVPQYVEGLSDVVRNPIHATGVGLLLYSKQALEAEGGSAATKLGLRQCIRTHEGVVPEEILGLHRSRERRSEKCSN